jgi:hypothetical protein
MKIFAGACDPVSWCKLLGVNSSNLLSAMTPYYGTNQGLFNNNALNSGHILRYLPGKYVSVPVTGNRCFMKWEYLLSYLNNGTKTWTYDPKKFIELYNSADELIASIGFKSGISFDVASAKSGLFSWTKAGAAKDSVIEGTARWNIIGVPDGYNSERGHNTGYALDYFVDPDTPANSYFAIYAGNREIARLTADQLTDNPNNTVAKIVFMRNWSSAFSTAYYGFAVNNLVVTDTPNFALKAVTVRPQALTYSVDFTGPITNISDTLQDANYISSSAETGKYIEFSLAKWTPNSNVTLRDFVQTKFLNLDIYFYGRYAQVGGISATFTITVFDDQGAKVLEKDIVVAANEDNIYYQTKFVDSVTLALLPFSQIVSGKVRITLKEI